VQGAHHDGPALDGLVEDHLVAEDDDLEGVGNKEEKGRGHRGVSTEKARLRHVAAPQPKKSKK
jgi:hypothetical protein